MSLTCLWSGHKANEINVVSTSLRPLLLLNMYMPLAGLNVICAMRASMVVPSFSWHFICSYLLTSRPLQSDSAGLMHYVFDLMLVVTTNLHMLYGGCIPTTLFSWFQSIRAAS